MLEREPLERTSRMPERVRLGVDILRVLTGAGLILTSIAMPNVAKLLPYLRLHEMRRRYRSDVSRALLRLKEQGFVQLVPTRNGKALRPTKKGQVLLARYEIGHLPITTQKRWDGKWRVIIFDIHEHRKQIRELVRLQLKRWGFYRLQDSVWVYPYDCEEVIELLKTVHVARHDIYYLLVQKMAQDKQLRVHFNLLKK